MTKQEFTYLLSEWRNNSISKADAERFLAVARSGIYNELLEDTLESHLMSGDLKGLFTIPDKKRPGGNGKGNQASGCMPPYTEYIFKNCLVPCGSYYLII